MSFHPVEFERSRNRRAARDEAASTEAVSTETMPSDPASAPVASGLASSRLFDSRLVPRSRRTVDWLWSVGLFVATAALFAPAVGNGFTGWDDPAYVTRNPLVLDASWSGFARIATTVESGNYHPLTVWSYWIEHALVGLDPWLYHLTNVLVHAGSVVLVWLLGRRWFTDRSVALAVAILFACHPLRVESVAWVAERKDVLCTFFFLATLLLFDRAVERRMWIAAIGIFVLALLSKVMAITLPAVLVAYVLYRRRRRDFWTRSQFWRLAPFWALTALFTVIGYVAQQSADAVKTLHGGSASTHVLTVVKAVGFYVFKLVVPVRLSAFYTFPSAQSLLEPLVLLGLVAIAASFIAMVVSWQRNRTVFLCLAFAWITWAPVSGIIPSTTPVADRYMYLPCLGVFWCVALLVVPLVREQSVRRPIVRYATGGAVVLVGTIFALGTVHRISDWRDNETLWARALEVDPSSSTAHNQLAVHYLDTGEYAAAVRHASGAIKAGRSGPADLFHLALAYRGLGDATRERACAESIRRVHPDFLAAWTPEVRWLCANGRTTECEKLVAQLEGVGGGHPDTLWARAMLEEAHGRWSRALSGYVAALEKRGGFRDALLGSARCLFSMGDDHRAATTLASLLDLRGGALFPDEVATLESLLTGIEASGDAAMRAEASRLRNRLTRRS